LSGLVSTIPDSPGGHFAAHTAEIEQVVLTGAPRPCDAAPVAYWYEPLGERPGHRPLTDIAGGRE